MFKTDASLKLQEIVARREYIEVRIIQRLGRGQHGSMAAYFKTELDLTALILIAPLAGMTGFSSFPQGILRGAK